MSGFCSRLRRRSAASISFGLRDGSLSAHVLIGLTPRTNRARVRRTQQTFSKPEDSLLVQRRIRDNATA